MSHKPSVTLAGPIWRSYMNAALIKLPKQDFIPPLPPLLPTQDEEIPNEEIEE